uniref:ARAD1D07172p n=1 Tax=Blastobotrys adeninivorans TaxID=409370 RepID=A0A060T8I6_BLAAD
MTSDQSAESVLKEVAKDGDFEKHNVTWDEFLPRVVKVLDTVVRTSFEFDGQAVIKDPLSGSSRTQDAFLEDVKKLLSGFGQDPPFTFQRIAELLTQPHVYYGPKVVHKFLHAVERSLMVESSVKEYPEKDLLKELENTQSARVDESGIVMSDISWVVDTGAPYDQGSPNEGKEEEHDQNEQVEQADEFESIPLDDRRRKSRDEEEEEPDVKRTRTDEDSGDKEDSAGANANDSADDAATN